MPSSRPLRPLGILAFGIPITFAITILVALTIIVAIVAIAIAVAITVRGIFPDRSAHFGFGGFFFFSFDFGSTTRCW